MKYPILLCSLLFLVACNTYPENPGPPFAIIQPGTYVSYNPDRLEWLDLYRQGIRGNALGITLTISRDSTYQMEGCTISRGRWRSDSGKLYLYMSYHNWRQDSLQRYGFKGKWPEISKEPERFTIKDDKLYEYYRDNKLIVLLQFQKGAE